MIKIARNEYLNQYIAYDTEQLTHINRQGISEANAIALVKYASNKHGIKVTEEEMRAIKDACTPF